MRSYRDYTPDQAFLPSLPDLIPEGDPVWCSQVDYPCFPSPGCQLQNCHCAQPYLLPNQTRTPWIHQENFLVGFNHRLMGVAEDNDIDRLTEDGLQGIGQGVSRRERSPDRPREDIVPQTLENQLVGHADGVTLQLDHLHLSVSRGSLAGAIQPRLGGHHGRDASKPVEAGGYVGVSCVKDKVYTLERLRDFSRWLGAGGWDVGVRDHANSHDTSRVRVELLWRIGSKPVQPGL